MIFTILNWGNDTTIAVAAVVLSFAAIIIGVYFNNKTFKHYKRHNILSVAPILDTSTHTDDTEGFTKLRISIINEGLGPALLYSIMFKLKDNEFVDSNDVMQLFIDEYGESSLKWTSARGLIEYTNFVIGPSKHYNLIGIDFKAGVDKKVVQDFLKDVKIRILFKNIYKQKGKMFHRLYS